LHRKSALWGENGQAGVDSAREQEKPEARKMLENATDSHTSGACFVGRFFAHKALSY